MDSLSLILLVFIGAAVLLAVYVLIKSRKSGKLTPSDLKTIQKEWSAIMEENKRSSHSAIIHADKLLGHVLGLIGYEGSVGDQLKKGGALFRDLNSLWDAHKMRNKVAHEVGIQISIKQSKRILNTFKRALNDLGSKLK
jgi:hypothetical protein